MNSEAIVQDDNGFIWLATTNGLIRHDSENSILINSANKNWPLPFSWINDIHLLDNNQLLLATETHKLWLFDTATGNSKQIATDIHRNSIYHVIEHQKMYYLHVPNKLYKVDPLLKTTQLLASNINIRSLQHTQSHVYISTLNDLFILKGENLEQIEVGQISAISAIGSTLFIASGNQLIALSDNNKRKSIFVNSPINAITPSHDLQSIFTTDKNGNINQYQLIDLTKISHRHPKFEPTFVTSTYHDSSGVLWVFSNNDVKKITPSTTKNTPKLFDVKYNSISLTVHQNQLVLGSYGAGLSTFFDDSRLLPANINEQFTADAHIITDLYSYQNSIYISTFDGLWQLNTRTKIIERVNFPNNNLILLSMNYKNNALYLGTNDNGVIKFDLASQSVEYHIKDDTLSSLEVIDTLSLPNNKLWLATANGINIVDTETNSVTQIASLGENKVVALLEHKNKIFASTKGDGLFVYNLQGELLSHFAKDKSFDYMSFINSEIWISGNPGLYRLNPDTYQLNLVPGSGQYNFTKKPVLLNNTVYAGYYGGVFEVPLTVEDTLHAKIIISKTIASGKAELLGSAINIDSQNDVITLELASLDFRPGQEKQFKYQINGGSWNDINGAQLTLTGLSSGNYHIEIMGTNSLGQWSNIKAYADINVAYPWYWQPTMRIIYVVLAIATLLLTAWLLYLRTRSISYIHQRLNEEISTHSQSTSIIRRKLIKIKSLMVSTQNSQQDTSTNNSKNSNLAHQEMQSLLNECLDSVSTQNSPAQLNSLSGSSLTVALPYLANHLKEHYHVSVTLQLDIKDNEIEYAIQSAIYRIVYEALLAEITNGNSGVFVIHINKASEKIWLKITNNEDSFGQFSNKINFDMSMYYIRQVANKFNATFHTYDNQERGSAIILSIPLMKLS